MVDNSSNNGNEKDKHLYIILLTLAGGVIGGLIGVISSWEVVSDTGWGSGAFWWDVIFLPSVKGAVAAFLGVYLFSPGKPDSITKTCAFAIACGLAFPGVLENAKTIGQNAGQQAARSHAKALEKNIQTKLQTEGLTGSDIATDLVRLAEITEWYAPQQADGLNNVGISLLSLENQKLDQETIDSLSAQISRYSLAAQKSPDSYETQYNTIPAFPEGTIAE